MEALAAISLAGNVIQFVELGTKLISRSAEIYRSTDGTLKETSDYQAITGDLKILSANLKASAVLEGDQTLASLCLSYNTLAHDFLSALSGITNVAPASKWKSFRKAVRSIWSKEKLSEIESRLSQYRDQITFHLVIELRTKYDLLAVKQSQHFDALEASAKALLIKLIDQRDIWELALDSQTTAIRSLHEDTQQITQIGHENLRVQIDCVARGIENGMTSQHDDIQKRLIDHEVKNRHLHNTTTLKTAQAIDSAEENLANAITTEAMSRRIEFEALKQEIAVLTKSVKQLTQQIKTRDEEHRTYLSALDRTRDVKKRRHLAEMTNAVTAALMALQIMRQALMALLSSLRDRATSLFSPQLVHEICPEEMDSLELTSRASNHILRVEEVMTQYMEYYYQPLVCTKLCYMVVQPQDLARRWIHSTGETNATPSFNHRIPLLSQFRLNGFRKSRKPWMMTSIVAVLVALLGKERAQSFYSLIITAICTSNVKFGSASIHAIRSDFEFWLWLAIDVSLMEYMKTTMRQLDPEKDVWIGARCGDSVIPNCNLLELAVLVAHLLGLQARKDWMSKLQNLEWTGDEDEQQDALQRGLKLLYSSEKTKKLSMLITSEQVLSAVFVLISSGLRLSMSHYHGSTSQWIVSSIETARVAELGSLDDSLLLLDLDSE